MMEKDNQVDEEVKVSLKLFVVLNRAMESIHKKVATDIKRYGLNLTEFAVLELLYHKGEQPIQKIGQKVLLASSSITYVVDKLEEKGYLVRKACPKDRRVTYADLTDEGNKFISSIFPTHEQEIHRIFGGLNSEEKKQMIDQIKKLGIHAQSL